MFEWSDCVVTNPLLTPCFYGALAFLAAFVWALVLLRSARAAGQAAVHPLLAPCFYGAMIFLAALATSLSILRTLR